MGWFTLLPVTTTEAVVQHVFDAWGKPPPEQQLVGVPQWLRDLGAPEARSSFTREGYSFRPDVVWRDHVAELKCGAKYEPLALAEALHHAQCLSVVRERSVTPVLVTSYSVWMRRSLEFLFTRGVSPEVIRYLEVGHLEAKSTQQRFMWFDVPFAPWTRAERVPGCVPQRTANSGHWYFVAETRTWCRVSTALRTRPIVPEGEVVLLSELDDGRYLYWQGTFDKVGDYFLYDESLDGDSPEPTLSSVRTDTSLV